MTIYDRILRDGVELLLIEDSVSDVHLIRIFLEEGGSKFKLTVADSLQDAKSRFPHDYDVIIIDLNLPDGSGQDNITEIRKLASAKTAIVVTTEISDPDIARRVIAVGAQDYITKSELSAESIRKAIVYSMERQQHLMELEIYKNELERLVEERTRELQESKERYRILSASSPSGVFRTDGNDRFTYVNEKWTEITGFDQSATLTHCLWDFIHPDEKDQCAKMWQKFIDDASIPEFSSETKMVHRLGHPLWVQIQANKIDRFADSGTVGLISDITKTKSLLSQLRELHEWR